MRPKAEEKRKRILRFIVQSIMENGIAPTLQEIADRFSMKSRGHVNHYIKEFVREGFIKRSRAARSIELVREKVGRLFPELLGVPLLGEVRAGPGLYAEENRQGILYPEDLLPEGRGYFALKVQRESMIQAGILDGDFLIVREQQNADVGDIVAAIVDGEEGMVKRFNRKDDQIILESANSEYPPITDKEVKVVGKVVRVIREL